MSIDFIRGIFAGLLTLIAVMLWNAWENEHAPPVTPAAQTTTTSTATNIATPVTSGTTTNGTLPHAATDTINATPVIVNTDVLQVKINPVGGTLTGAKLSQYPISDKDSNPYVLLNDQTNTFYSAQSGLIGAQGPDQNQAALYQAAQTRYNLDAGKETLTVPLVWQKNGVTITKTFTFTRGSYLVHVSYNIKNASSQTWNGQFYTQLKRTAPETANHGLFHINPFVGAVISSPDKRYQKLTFAELSKDPVNQSIQNGWMAMEEHYFVTAWIPDPNQNYQYSSQIVNNNLYAVNMVSPNITVAPGQSQDIGAKIYIGPSIASTLKTIAPGLDLTVDYGFLWFIGVILFWLLAHIHQFIGNWGWSIVLLTVFIKLCFYKLSETSFRSMAAMRKLQPQLQQLKERYGDDKQKLSQATMELYRKEKVNPMGGCLPMLVQIPVFIALYWVLLESVQLRMAPFIFWIHDLSAQDPYYILPILFGISMFLQQRMSPPPPDPMMAKMMMGMPIIFTFFFLSFPSGLVLYWVVNNSITILQQWFINKRIDKK